ncbi:hypothetical protein XH97_03085 [Bradyrhizobium sp. CCBAU 53380]|nr:hypothetical protein [Bradyrhizobium sp. CCBAU 53380]
MIAAVEGSPMQRYYFPIIHNGRLQEDGEGEMFGSADLASQYGASVARDKRVRSRRIAVEIFTVSHS